MDITLARTFSEIVSTGSFQGAAQRLNVTQSAISMRIRALEDHLGRKLFVRNKSGANLTSAGVQFQRYATALAQTWEQACHHIAVPETYRTVLSIGGQFSLCDGILLDWMPWMEKNVPDVSLRVEYGQAEDLMVRLADGALDLAVMYTPQSRPGLKVTRIFEETLSLVSTSETDLDTGISDYVFVDWGPEFLRFHQLNFPEILTPTKYLSLGTLGLKYLLDCGGSGFFPERVTRSYIESGTVNRVENSPQFFLSAYVVSSDGFDKELLKLSIDGLKKIAKGDHRILAG